MSKLIGLTISLSTLEKPENTGTPTLQERERRWEHTYVASDYGDKWGCFGRSDGGFAICQGEGDVELAQCLAQADGLAGISYLVNGVCHQTANRILYPASVIVSKAKGYTFSSSLFGHYGLGGWPQLRACSEIQSETLSYDHEPRGLRDGPSPYFHFPLADGLEESSPMQPSSNIYHNDVRRKAFIDAIDERLGADYDLKKRRQLLDAQLEGFEPQDLLVTAFQNGEMPAEAFFVEFTKLSHESFSKYQKILGRDDFIRLFDFAPEESPPPGDPELFARAHGLSTVPKIPD